LVVPFVYRKQQYFVRWFLLSGRWMPSHDDQHNQNASLLPLTRTITNVVINTVSAVWAWYARRERDTFWSCWADSKTTNRCKQTTRARRDQKTVVCKFDRGMPLWQSHILVVLGCSWSVAWSSEWRGSSYSSSGEDDFFPWQALPKLRQHSFVAHHDQHC